MSVKFLMESYSLVFPVCGEDGTLAAMPLCPSAASPACGEDGLKGGFSFFFNAVSSCAWEKPFQECDSFSRHMSSRFNDRRPA